MKSRKRLSRLILWMLLVASAVRAEPEGTLSGRVVADGRPVARARVRAVPAPTRYGQEKPPQGAGWTDDDGAFRISGLRTGWTYSVIVDRGAFAPFRQLVEAPARLRIRVQPGAETSGRVVDTGGQPVEGALIRIFVSRAGDQPEGWLDPERFVPLQATSGPDGRFLYRNLAPGRYDLQVAHEGLTPRMISDLKVPDRARAVGFGDIRLEPGAVIDGIVTDEEGRRVAGAQVGFTSTTSDPRATDRYTPVETGPDGAFRMESLPPGERFDLWVNAPGYVAGMARVESPTSYPVTITLQRDRGLTIRVVDPERRPVPEAHVSRVREGGGSQSVAGLGRTDGEGSLRLAGLDGETVDVLIQAEGFRPMLARGVPVPADPAANPAEIVLDRGAVLEGQVLDADGNPVVQARVSARRNPSEPFVGLLPIATDREGRYRLRGVPPGSYQVAVESDDLAPKLLEEIEIGPEGDHRLDFSFPAGSLVSGQVVDAQGRPIPRARLSLLSTEEEGDAFKTVSRPDGTFSFQAVPDGDFRLEAEAAGFALGRVPDGLRVEGEPVAGLLLSLRPGIAITGRLLGYDTSRRPRVHVHARSQESSPRPVRLYGTVDRYGVYRIPDAYPGQWIVRVDLPDRRFVEQEVEVIDQPVSLDLEIER